MPGGKVTVKHDLPDLESFLARKRYPLDKWLAANNITSIEAFKSLLSSDKWIVSSELQRLVSELFKPVFVPPTAVVEVAQVEDVQTSEVESAIAVEEPVVEQPETYNTIQETVAPVTEEPNQLVEEVSLSHSFKERKKHR